jgi:hypothetical protein
MDGGGLLANYGGNHACKPTKLNFDAVFRGFVTAVGAIKMCSVEYRNLSSHGLGTVIRLS